MTVLGIDVSEYQTGLRLADARREGAEFVVARATRGPELYRDPAYIGFREQAKDLRMPFAAYHFLGEDPQREAQRILRHVEPGTPIMLDLEPADRFHTRPTYADALTLRVLLREAGRRVPLLYLPRWYWEQIGRPNLAADGWGGLVASRYLDSRPRSLRELAPPGSGEGWQPYGGMVPVLWQYAETVRVPGYTGNSVDGNAYRGTLPGLLAHGYLRTWGASDNVPAMTWRVANSLQTLLAEVNAVAPYRSTLSDGSIGDAAHATRQSDHNPWIVVNGVGVVRARDFTHDTTGGPTATLDADQLAGHLAALLGKHPALASGAYVIRNRRIISTDRLSEGWRPYTGSNPHDKHVHLSVTTHQSGFDSIAPWGWSPPAVPKEDEDPMANLDEKTLKLIGDAVSEAVWTREFPAGRTAGQMLGGIFARTQVTRDLARRMKGLLPDGATVSEDELADALAKAAAQSE